MDLWDTICQELNLTYRMLPPTTTGYGARLANGSWVGMVGELAEEVRTEEGIQTLQYRLAHSSLGDFRSLGNVFTKTIMSF